MADKKPIDVEADIIQKAPDQDATKIDIASKEKTVESTNKNDVKQTPDVTSGKKQKRETVERSNDGSGTHSAAAFIIKFFSILLIILTFPLSVCLIIRQIQVGSNKMQQ